MKGAVEGRTAVLDDGDEPGTHAMARDQALVEAARDGQAPEAIVRGHGWTSPVLSLGRGQKLPSDLETDAADAGVALVRRPTGGGWLLHLPGDPSLTLVRGGPLSPGDLRRATRTVAQAIADALEALGLPAVVFLGGPPGLPPGSAPAPGLSASGSPAAHARATREEICFRRTDRDEVTVDGVKVAGVALARQGRAAVVQSAIPLALPAPGPLAAFAARWDPDRAAALRALRGVTAEALRPRALEAALRRLGGARADWSWTDAARARAAALVVSRFARPAFTRTGLLEEDEG